MSNFDLEKIKEELSVYDPLMPCVVKALRVIGRLCEEGQKLEQQRDFFLKVLNDNRLCPNGGCFHDGSDMDEWDCTSYDNRECWITAAMER